MKPIATFSVRPERGSRLSVSVEVYRTVGEFRAVAKAEAKKCGLRYRTRGLAGECVGVTVRGRRTRRITPQFAIVRLPKRHLTMSTITHEAFHATMRWAARRKLTTIPTNGGTSNLTGKPSMVPSIEERAATVHDQLCRLIVVECVRRKLLPS